MLEDIIADRQQAEGIVGVSDAVVAGHAATVFRWVDGELDAVWQQGDAVARLMTWRSPLDESAFAQLLAAVTQVDAETWLSALPGDVVRSEDVVSAAGEMLGGAALPNGREFAPTAGVITRRQLASVVESDARCAWVEEWIRATDAGDAAATEAARTALAGVSGWPVQPELGGPDESEVWNQIRQATGDAMRQIVDDGVLPGGRDLEIAGDTEVEGWRVELDCYAPTLLR